VLIDQVLLTDAVEGLRSLPEECVPMTLTSPPYDGLRDYHGNVLPFGTFMEISLELWRVTMHGGVVVWVVADQIDRGYSGTSFRQAIHFIDSGWTLHDLLIMGRSGGRWSGGNRYGKVEFAFVLSKGPPRSVHLIRDKPNRHAGVIRRFKARSRDGILRHALREKPVARWGVRGPVWDCLAGAGKTTRDLYAYGHPALMPEAMARDHILSWSRPGELILDPMCGAATTCKMALLNYRHFLGFEAAETYHRIALRRMEDARAEHRRRLDAWLTGD
jgi:DNA modification methylase